MGVSQEEIPSSNIFWGPKLPHRLPHLQVIDRTGVGGKMRQFSKTGYHTGYHTEMADSIVVNPNVVGVVSSMNIYKGPATSTTPNPLAAPFCPGAPIAYHTYHKWDKVFRMRKLRVVTWLI